VKSTLGLKFAFTETDSWRQLNMLLFPVVSLPGSGAASPVVMAVDSPDVL